MGPAGTAAAPMRAPEPALDRSIGVVGAVGFGLGAMVGTGVCVDTGVGAGMAGPVVLASLVLAGLAGACNGLSSAELAAVYPRAGGTDEYAGRLLIPWAGYLAGWPFLAPKTSSAAATALAFGAYLGGLLGIPLLGVTWSLVAGVTLLNFFRLTRAKAINLILVLLSVPSLLIFVVTVPVSWSPAWAGDGWRARSPAD
jgi:APA family basic amino acid/polyamine antiporter